MGPAIQQLPAWWPDADWLGAFSWHVASSNIGQDRMVALPTIDVRVRIPGNDSYVDTYAILDSGSLQTVCTDKLLNALRIEEHREHGAISNLRAYSYYNASRVVNLKVSYVYGHGEQTLKGIHSKDNLPGLMRHVEALTNTEYWPHIGGLSLPKALADQVALLFHQANSEGLVPLFNTPMFCVSCGKVQQWMRREKNGRENVLYMHLGGAGIRTFAVFTQGQTCCAMYNHTYV